MFHRWRRHRDEDDSPEDVPPKERRYDPSQGGNEMRRRGKRMQRSLDRVSLALIGMLLLAMVFGAPGWVFALVLFGGIFGMMGSFVIHALYDPRGGDKKEEP